MSDRVVREQQRAVQQRLERLESQMRALRLRAWPGAMRTEQSQAFFVPTSPTEYSPMVSLTVPAGRWLVLGSGGVGLTGFTADPEQFILSTFGTFISSGDLVPDDHFDNPSGYLWMPPFTTGSSAIGSIMFEGDLIAEEKVTVVLAIANTNGAAFAVFEPRLRLIPM